VSAAGLSGLAARYGVARSYRTDRGERVDVHRDTIVAVLDALGVQTTGRGWITKATEAFDTEQRASPVPPVQVAWDGVLGAPPAGSCELVLEDGSTRGVDPSGVDALPPGYHTLVVRDGTRTRTVLVVSTPRRAWRPPGRARHWGVYAPLFALHRRGRSGPGELGDLARLLEWVCTHGGDTVLTLPLLAAFLDEPAEVSPYSPVSRLMWNELYATLDRDATPAAGGGLLDYHAAASSTRAAIQAQIAGVDADPVASGELLRYLAERPDVADYARFRAAQARHGRVWRAWPDRLRRGELTPADVDPSAARYHQVAQWLVDRQLAVLARGARDRDLLLGLDLAIGTHPDGYDVWRHQEVFATRATVGAPPDTFFVGGQDWGFPPLLPAAARRGGHEYFVRALRHHLRHATLLRVDHVMGLQRLYWIPQGADATEGTYVDYPADELFAILTLESHRAKALVVGEDLGTVPPSVRNALRAHALTGTWVAQGALEDVPTHGAYTPPSRRSLASLNTHDMPTFAGFVAGSDIDDREDLGQIDHVTALGQHRERDALVGATQALVGATDTPSLLRRLLEQIGASNAGIVLVNLEDLWLEPRPHNVPGTSTQRPNWRRPAAFGVDELDAVPGVAALLAALREARHGAGRARTTS
jgi:4-alpha-glucanotransferase